MTNDQYPKTIAEVGEEGYNNLLHIAPEDRNYQRGWNDGYALRTVNSLLILDDDYWHGYQAGLDEVEREEIN